MIKDQEGKICRKCVQITIAVDRGISQSATPLCRVDLLSTGVLQGPFLDTGAYNDAITAI